MQWSSHPAARVSKRPADKQRKKKLWNFYLKINGGNRPDSISFEPDIQMRPCGVDGVKFSKSAEKCVHAHYPIPTVYAMVQIGIWRIAR